MERIGLGETEKNFFKEIVAYETVKTILQVGAFQLFFDEPVTFSFGIKSPMKIEADRIRESPREFAKIVGLLSQLMNLEGLQPSVIVGVISGAVPFAKELAKLTGCRFAARLGRKRGEFELNQVEGLIQPKEEVLILDDVATTGGNIVLAKEQIQQEGGVVGSCLTIFSYELPQAQGNFKQQGLNHYAASQFSILLALAGRMDFMPGEARERLLGWHQSIQEASR